MSYDEAEAAAGLDRRNVRDYVEKAYGIKPKVPTMSQTDRTLLTVFCIVDAALYLSGVFVAGLVMHQPMAWFGALVSTGLGYLCGLMQLQTSKAPVIAAGLLVGSLVVAAVAGVSLTFPG